MITGKDWDELNESIRPLMFRYGFLLPSSWRRKAARIKYAADRLFDLYEEARTRFLQRFSKEEGGTGCVSTWSTAPEAEFGKDATDMSLITEYLLLMGYALENLLKGILMADHPEYFKTGAKITEIRSHNLVSLCRRCSLVVSAAEEDLLKTLTDHIEWVGKYPVPLEEAGMYPRKKADGRWNGPSDQFGGGKAKTTIEGLYSRILEELIRREPEETEQPNDQ
ncbi:MAG: hypothetical protein ACLQVM_12540 [Terriglobia bacterium]